jgi:transcription-repair coupling factor (superfamily II helicase)
VPESRPLPSAAGEEAKDLFSWLERINSYVAEGDRVVVLAKNKGRLNLLRQQCREHGIQAALLAQPFALGSFLGAAHTAEVQLACGSLPDLYRDVESRTLYLPCEKIYGAVNQRRKSSSAKRLQSMLLSQQHLVSGDLVVHQHHGIGRYMAVEQLVVGNSTGDFIKIEYQKGDKIYLPVAHINLLQKYQSQAAGSGSSSLDLLRGTSWQNRKAKVKKAVKDIAQELLNLQAQRQTLKGYAYGAAGELYQQFCDDFPYAPTEDQQRAIADVEADLASNKVMDRMVIGDVGFGKTEVALRAAFRVMCEGFQVLVLVPTTILCFQHYETIRKRMNKYGLQCSFVNRYIATAEQKKRVQLFAEGKIDIIVGTHRLLSKDVKAKNLGLIIIDEEQKFGVEHKEKLKTMRLQADLLLLTATPIPRSLHMAMLGLREISLIATPPPDRLPVKTIVAHFSDALLRQTIAAEFARGGQVFFVHNRVEDIEQVCSHLLSLVPFAKIGCAHGQMHERQLEQVMLDFFEQKTTILVCTAIIEAGIDLPNVNTLIVNNADHFGLSQLYQLRGRVGRSDVQGYAYLLVKNEHIITAEGKKRLEVLQSYQDLGAGMQIANYDLEIRGAGNLLGGEQSGHVAAVGLEYYNQMLNDTIASLAGKQLREEIDSEVKIPICAFIPQSYMPREFDRLKTYRQLFAAENRGEIEEVFNGVVDQFGAPPVEICRLIHVASLKKSLQGIKASKLHYVGPGRYQLNFRPLAESEIAHIVGMVQQHPQAYSLASGFVVEIHLGKSSLLEEDQQLILLQQRVEQLQCK